MRYFYLIFVLCVVAVVGIAGKPRQHFAPAAHGIFPDMDRQPKLRPQTPDAIFRGRQEFPRLPVAGTDRRAASRNLRASQSTYQDSPVTPAELTGTTNFVEIIAGAGHCKLARARPATFQHQLLALPWRAGGRQRHHRKIGVMAVVANLHDKRIVEMADGEIFNTITYGKKSDGPLRAECPGRRSLGHHRLFARVATEPVGHR